MRIGILRKQLFLNDLQQQSKFSFIHGPVISTFQAPIDGVNAVFVLVIQSEYGFIEVA